MAPDIDAATEILKEQKVWFAVKPHMDRYFMEQGVETRPSSPTTSTVSMRNYKRKLSSSYSNGTNGYTHDGHCINAYESDDEVFQVPKKLPRSLSVIEE